MMWIASLPLWFIAFLCLGGTWQRAKIHAANPNTRDCVAVIIGLIFTSIFAILAVVVWRL